MSVNQPYPNLSKSPIQAAIFEIRYQWLNPEKDASSFSSLSPYVRNYFPTSKAGNHQEINLNQSPDKKTIKSTVTKQYIRDYKFISESKKNILLASRDRFNLNIGDKYVSWEHCMGVFKHSWKAFFGNVIRQDEISITGISARFINKIDLDQVNNPVEYFKTTIYAEDGVIPETVTSYLLNYRVTTADQIHLLITQGFEPILNGKNTYIFDIDVINNNINNSSDLWSEFERLHDNKNKVFFSNLTETTLKLLI
jgi:uncharacterized protein (TIGR04255 family)